MKRAMINFYHTRGSRVIGIVEFPVGRHVAIKKQIINR
jgi:hypothetical protein